MITQKREIEAEREWKSVISKLNNIMIYILDDEIGVFISTKPLRQIEKNDTNLGIPGWTTTNLFLLHKRI